MKPWRLFLSVGCAVSVDCAATSAFAAPAGTKTSTTAVTTKVHGLSLEELELAAYLELLEDFELLSDLDLLELLPVLEDER